MHRIAKLVAVGAAAAGLALGVQPAARAGSGDLAGTFPTEAQCVTAGDQGVAAHDWAHYNCAFFEGVWDLNVFAD